MKSREEFLSFIEGFTREADKETGVGCCVIAWCGGSIVGVCGTLRGRWYYRLRGCLELFLENRLKRR